MQELTLARIAIHQNLSGYVYLNMPKSLCEAFHIGPEGYFQAVYRDGKLILSYVKGEGCLAGS